jgi:cell division protein FtsQ
VTAFDNTAPHRFFRPADAARVRRNLRQIQLQRVFGLLRTAVFVMLAGAGVYWAYRQTQSDARFAVRHIEVAGAVHVPAAALSAITARYLGLNLFKIDIANVQHDLGSLPWVERIAIEKKIPDTLRIKVIERSPVALAARAGRLEYVDARGVVLAPLSPAVGDADLPIITADTAEELTRTVKFAESLRRQDTAVFSRIAEIRPVVPAGFAVFDRELGATVYVNDADASAQWRSLYAILAAEKLGHAAIEYADLRFSDRVIIKPVHPIVVPVAAVVSTSNVPITN